MSDPKQQLDPFQQQLLDPKFQELSYDEQMRSRMSLFMSKAETSPAWQVADDKARLDTLKNVADSYPPAFSNPSYDVLRKELEASPAQRFAYSHEVQEGQTSLLVRGTANVMKGITHTIGGFADRVGQFFGGKPQAGIDPIMGALTGDKDALKLAQYLRRRYEKTVNIPLIGGGTPSQITGSLLGVGTDFAAMRGPAGAVDDLVEGALKASVPVLKTGIQMAARAGATGTLGVARGFGAAGMGNMEGAIDLTHGIKATAISTGEVFGQWAAQDFVFGLLGRGVGYGLRQTWRAVGKALIGKGTAVLPRAEAFGEVSEGAKTPGAEDIQKRFETGNVAPVSEEQLGPAARDHAQSFREAMDYAKQDPDALLKNPVAATRVGAQIMQQGKNTPFGVAIVPDSAEATNPTWRIRQGPGKGGKVLGEHLSFNEVEMILHDAWKDEKAETQTRYEEWNKRYEQFHTDNDKQIVQSAQLHLEGLNDFHPHLREISDSLDHITQNMDRFAPEGAARKPSEGSMLTYGEVGQLQNLGLKAAKVQIALDPKTLPAISDRGTLVDTHNPTKLETVSGGNFNATVIYSHGAPEPVWQAALSRADEYLKSGTTGATREQLAFWQLRDMGYDAIEHSDGGVTALYPKQQIKHVSDLVNKSSREYIMEPERPIAPATSAAPSEHPTTYRAPVGLSQWDQFGWLIEAASREGGTQVGKLPSGEYGLVMKGYPPVQGDLGLVVDTFLGRNTTPAHLRASLEDEGMHLRVDKGQYTIIGTDGKPLGNGPTAYDAMLAAKYRPSRIDGRFGPRNVEILPDGSPFEYTAQGVRGTLRDVYQYVNSFMDVAEEEGKRTISTNEVGKLSQGHDGGYTVEIPGWGIHERFESGAEAREYLDGRYKEYDNVQRLANERGFLFTYDAKRGYTLTDVTGTYAIHNIDEAGRILSQKPDPRWGPGGQYEAGVKLKDSAAGVKLPVDTDPAYAARFPDRSSLGQALSRAKSQIANLFGPTRAYFSRQAREFGHREVAEAFNKLADSIKSRANQDILDVAKIHSLESLYRFSDEEARLALRVSEAYGEEARTRVFEDHGIPEGSPLRPKILDAARRLDAEFYTPMFQRTGQDAAKMLKDFAPKVRETKVRDPQAYQEMELSGPGGMRKLITNAFGGRVPDDMNFASLHERVADFDATLKEENIFHRAIRYALQANKWFYTGENMANFWKTLHAEGIPEEVRLRGQQYIDQVMTGNRSDALKIYQAISRQGKTAPGGVDAISVAKTLTGLGAYGFRPGVAQHVVQSSYLVASGLIGTEAINHGFEVMNKGGAGHLAELFRKGVFTGNSPILKGVGDTSFGANFIDRLMKSGVFFTQNAHVLSKAAVYDGASWLFDRMIKPWVDGGKIAGWELKSHQIRGYLLDTGARDQMEAFLKQGNYEAAKHVYAQNMTDIATYNWRPEDQGQALNRTGILSRIYGQLMIAPTQFASALARIAGEGSFTDRLTNLATYGKNTAAFYAANKSLGMSGSNLLPWKTISLNGGPLFQYLAQMTSERPGQREMDAVMRFLDSMPPVSWVKQGQTVVKELQAEHPWAAFLTLMGESVTPELRVSGVKGPFEMFGNWLGRNARAVGSQLKSAF